MTRTGLIRLILMLIALVGLSVGCSQVYVPTAKTGFCKPGRTWVAPAQNAQGEWRDGYCREG